jgi:hypothetical protein
MCDRASYMKMTRVTNLMQKFWFIFINISTQYNIQHNLNQQLHNTTNNIKWNHPLTHSSLLQCWTPYAVVYNLNSWRWAYRCPKHVETFMIINQNFCNKLVPLVILTYFYESVININARWWFIWKHVPTSTAAYTKNEVVLYMKHTRGMG